MNFAFLRNSIQNFRIFVRKDEVCLERIMKRWLPFNNFSDECWRNFLSPNLFIFLNYLTLKCCDLELLLAAKNYWKMCKSKLQKVLKILLNPQRNYGVKKLFSMWNLHISSLAYKFATPNFTICSLKKILFGSTNDLKIIKESRCSPKTCEKVFV